MKIKFFLPCTLTAALIILMTQVVNSQLPSSITLTKTVGTTAGVCSATSNITVAAGTTVYYCYTVTNTGSTTLNLHDLVDNQLGTIFTGLNYTLSPGSSINTVDAGLSIPAVINFTTTNTATWKAYNEGPSDIAEAQASATVNITTGTLIPISDWALYFGIFLVFVFIVARYLIDKG